MLKINTLAGFMALYLIAFGFGFQPISTAPPPPEPLLPGKPSNGWASEPAVSADGRIVVFLSTTPGLVPDDENYLADVFAIDRRTGRLDIASTSSDGRHANGWSYRISLSSNGRFVAFTSLADNLVNGDVNGLADIFVHDLLTGETKLVSRASGGGQSNGWSDWPAISSDGRYIAFSSAGDNLVFGDTNRTVDVFVHDQLTLQTQRVSVSSTGAEGRDASGWATAISGDGRWIAFTSQAGNLTAGDQNDRRDVFLHNRVTGKTIRAPAPWQDSPDYLGSDFPALSGTGAYLAFTASQKSAPDTIPRREDALLVYLPGSGVLREIARTTHASLSESEFQQPVINGQSLAYFGHRSVGAGGAEPQISVIDLSSGDGFQLDSSQGQDVGLILIRDRPAVSDGSDVLAFTGRTTGPAGADSRQPEIYLFESEGIPDFGFTLSGQVTDSGGMPLRSAVLSLTSGISTSSDRQGYFYLSGVQTGTYELNVSKEGFQIEPNGIGLKVEGDQGEINLTAHSEELLEEARKDIGMPYSFHRGCESELEGCGGPFHGFRAGYCTDLILDAFRYGVDFNLQFALERDALAHPDHYYRWRNARNAHDMWRYFHYTEQMLANTQPYQPGDILFFDWDGDAVIDHVSLLSEVDDRGRPKKMLDATGTIAYNPGGLAAELDWESFHERTIRGHGRWLGSYGATRPATPPDLQVLQIAIDSGDITARLIDTDGHTLSPSAGGISGGSAFEQQVGTVLSVVSPRARGDTYLLELSGRGGGSYNLQIQTLEGGLVIQYLAFNQQFLGAGEVKYAGIQLLEEQGNLSFRVIQLD